MNPRGQERLRATLRDAKVLLKTSLFVLPISIPTCHPHAFLRTIFRAFLSCFPRLFALSGFSFAWHKADLVKPCSANWLNWLRAV